MLSKHTVNDQATLKPRNQNLESGNKNQKYPETGNWNPEIKENKFFKYAKVVLLSFLPLKKNCSQVKRTSNLTFF